MNFIGHDAKTYKFFAQSVNPHYLVFADTQIKVEEYVDGVYSRDVLTLNVACDAVYISPSATFMAYRQGSQLFVYNFETQTTAEVAANGNVALTDAGNVIHVLDSVVYVDDVQVGNVYGTVNIHTSGQKYTVTGDRRIIVGEVGSAHTEHEFFRDTIVGCYAHNGEFRYVYNTGKVRSLNKEIHDLRLTLESCRDAGDYFVVIDTAGNNYMFAKNAVNQWRRKIQSRYTEPQPKSLRIALQATAEGAYKIGDQSAGHPVAIGDKYVHVVKDDKLRVIVGPEVIDPPVQSEWWDGTELIAWDADSIASQASAAVGFTFVDKNGVLMENAQPLNGSTISTFASFIEDANSPTGKAVLIPELASVVNKPGQFSIDEFAAGFTVDFWAAPTTTATARRPLSFVSAFPSRAPNYNNRLIVNASQVGNIDSACVWNNEQNPILDNIGSFKHEPDVYHHYALQYRAGMWSFFEDGIFIASRDYMYRTPGPNLMYGMMPVFGQLKVERYRIRRGLQFDAAGFDVNSIYEKESEAPSRKSIEITSLGAVHNVTRGFVEKLTYGGSQFSGIGSANNRFYNHGNDLLAVEAFVHWTNGEQWAFISYLRSIGSASRLCETITNIDKVTIEGVGTLSAYVSPPQHVTGAEAIWFALDATQRVALNQLQQVRITWGDLVPEEKPVYDITAYRDWLSQFEYFALRFGALVTANEPVSTPQTYGNGVVVEFQSADLSDKTEIELIRSLMSRYDPTIWVQYRFENNEPINEVTETLATLNGNVVVQNGALYTPSAGVANFMSAPNVLFEPNEDFCISLWFNTVRNTNLAGLPILGVWNSETTNTLAWQIQVSESKTTAYPAGVLRAVIASENNNELRVNLVSQFLIQSNVDYHVEFSRTNNVLRLFIDGVLQDSKVFDRGTPNISMPALRTNILGGGADANYINRGKIWDIQIKKGSGGHLIDFTPEPLPPYQRPTYSEEEVSDVVLQLGFRRGSKQCEVTGNTLTTYGTAKVGTDGRLAQTNVTTSYAEIPISYFGAGDFTIEFMCNFSAVHGTNGASVGHWAASSVAGDANRWNVHVTPQRGVNFALARSTNANDFAVVASDNGVFALNKDNHIVIQRVGNVVSVYVDGNAVASAEMAFAVRGNGGALRTNGMSNLYSFAGSIWNIRIADKALYH